MRKKLTLVMLVVSLLLSGCGPLTSLFGLYSKDSLATNDALIGRWQLIDPESKEKEKSPCCIVFTKNGDSYAMAFPNPDDKQMWRSEWHLVRLGDAMFVDIEPSDVKYTRTTEIGFPQMEVHHFGRIWIEKDSVKVALVADDWFDKLAKAGKAPLPFVRTDHGLVMTATTEQLQAFAREHADDKEVFSDEYYFRRASAAAGARSH